MSILLNRDSRVIVQGMTGRVASYHTRLMQAYGTRLVAGIAPGKGGAEYLGIPVFDSVEEARAAHGVDASVLFLPPSAARDGILEAIYCEIPVIVCVTEGIPVHDMIVVAAKLEGSRSRLIGPNCPGIITPGEAKAGFLPERAARKGSVGVVSRSGTLSYETCFAMTRRGIGQSTWIGVGGDAIKGSAFSDLLPLFERDPETRAVVLIGEIGGRDEEEAAEICRREITKPVIGLISGRSAPQGKQMGHAGAIVSGERGSYGAKVEALGGAGVRLAESPAQVAEILISLSIQ